MTNIQVYANNGVNIESEPNTTNVFLRGVDVAQVVNEFSAKEVLECIELSEIEKFLKEAINE